jgi:heme A synthase
MHDTSTLGASRHGGRSLTTRLQGLFTFRSLAVITVIATYGLIVLGGTVRATDSGTACPDWPLCHGQVIPPMETKVLIEFAHRLVASVVGFMILGVVYLAWKRYRGEKTLVRLAAATVVLLASQVIVGGITVGTETAPVVVSIHLTLALTLFSILIYFLVRVFREEARAEPGSWRLGRLPAIALAGTFVLIITGAFVSQTGAGLAYPDWPLFDGGVFSAGGRLADLHWAHRLLAVLVGVLLLAYTLRALRPGVPQAMLIAATGGFILYSAQVLIGAANVWFELATFLRILHLALASALWGMLAFSVIWAFQHHIALPGRKA